MRISLQQIETFYWVARLGGFHAAARHQHLTQPTISARIQDSKSISG
jgi:DNA-binding transcriptional LysR family regulator